MADIGPKLHGDVINHLRLHLLSPIPGGLLQAALLGRIINIGESSFQGSARHLGPIEGPTARIGSGNHRTRECIACAPEKAAVPQRVIARVLMRYDRYNGSGEEVIRHTIGKNPPIVAGITFYASTKL